MFIIFAKEIEIKTMARLKCCRKVIAPPLMLGFKPFGIVGRELDTIVLHYDEYESIRLLDYEGLTQEQAAERMCISRPTLTRIYENARKTVAKAFVEGKQIVISGGRVDFGQKWYRCKRCNKLVRGNENHKHCESNGESYIDGELIPIK